MAKVPFTGIPEVAPTGPPDDYQHIQSSPDMFGGLIGQAAGKVAGDLKEGGSQLYQAALEYRQMQNATDALNATTSASQELGDAEAKFRQLSGENATAAYPAFQKQVTDIQAKYAGTLQNPTAQMAFQRDFKALSTKSLYNAGIHVGEQAKAAHLNALDSSIKSEQANLVRYTMTGQEPDYGPLIDRTLMLAHEKGLSQESADAMIQQTTGKAVADMVTARMAQGDIDGADKVFQDALKQNAPNTQLPLLDADHQAKLMQSINYQKMLAEHRAETEENKQAAVARVNLTHDYSAAAAIVDNGQSAMTALTGLSDARIDAAYPRNPEMADDVKSRVNDLRQTSAFLARIEGSSPDQLAKLLTDVPKPDPNDPATYQERLRMNHALTTAMEHTVKALSTDPASYVLGHHPEYGPLLQAAQKDPSQFPAYAQAVLGSQDQMGVPKEMQHVFPASMATSIAQQIEANPEQAPATIKTMQQQYGQAWPNVWRDLSTLGKMPMAYQAVGTLEDERDGALLARWLGEAKKSQKTADDLLGAKPVSDIKTDVRGDPGVHDLLSSLSRSGASTGQIDGVLTAIDNLAYAKSFYDRDGKATVNAIAAFTGKYDFSLPGGPRVPAKSADAVGANARLTLQGLRVDDLAVPAAYGHTGTPAKDEYLDLIRGAPSWVTSPTADALWLMDPYGRVVRDQRGKPIDVPFSAPAPAFNASSDPASAVMGTGP